MAHRFLLHVTVDIDPHVEDEWNEWYNQKHIPEILLCPGFLNARRYRRVDPQGTRYLAIYEMESAAAVESDEFNRVRGWYKFAPFVSNPKVIIYEEMIRSQENHPPVRKDAVSHGTPEE